MSERPKLTDRQKALLIRLAVASEASPVGTAMLIGNEKGESRVIPNPGDVTEEEFEAIAEAAFARPEIPLDQLRHPS